MKILILYAGIGGVRKKWGNSHNITAVEFDAAIAKAYQDRYPNDTVIVGDAIEYLLNHYLEFDFIQASPPCQSHGLIINSQYTRENYKAKLPDMSLYQIILFLQGHCRNIKWVVENVKPYYTPLIKPTVEINRHLFWSNYKISKINHNKKYIIKNVTINTLKDFDISKYKDIKNKRQVIRNQIDYDIGKHLLDCATDNIKVQTGLFEQ